MHAPGYVTAQGNKKRSTSGTTTARTNSLTQGPLGTVGEWGKSSLLSSLSTTLQLFDCFVVLRMCMFHSFMRDGNLEERGCLFALFALFAFLTVAHFATILSYRDGAFA
jgi:hypothetical protein